MDIKNQNIHVSRKVGISIIVAALLVATEGILYGFITGVAVVVIALIWDKQKLDKEKKLRKSGVVIALAVIACGIGAYMSRTPSLTITSPADGSSIQASSIAIEGHVSPSDSLVTINGAQITLNGGKFNFAFPLPKDTNTATIQAVNVGKTVTKTITITRTFSDQEKADMAAQALKAQQDADAVKAKQAADDAAYFKTPAGKLCKKHADWSSDDCDMVARGRLWIGMTLDMVKAEYGTPDTANPSNYGSGNQWQWCWTDYTPSCFYGGDDGIITSYN